MTTRETREEDASGREASEIPRQIIVVDCETTGLDAWHYPVEVAWWNLATDQRGCFVPPHERWLFGADPQALACNRYEQRIAHRVVDADYTAATVLAQQLAGNILAGSAPAFDAGMLRRLFVTCQGAREGGRHAAWRDPWHHRLLDLAAYTAGAVGLDPARLPGLDRVCQLLGVDYDPEAAHGAEHDVTATGRCFRALIRHDDTGEGATDGRG
ncbi:MAG: 3'-5' exonuclease [Pseudonocardiaceae bacterium]